jgi:hypothetical protein
MAYVNAQDGPCGPMVMVDGFEVLGFEDMPFGNNSIKFELIPVSGHENLQCYISK